MSRLDELYKVTVELSVLLDEEITNDNREQIISKVEILIDKRENLMKEVIPPFSESEKKLGKTVINLNTKIEQKLEKVFSELKNEMRQIQKQKKSNRSYINPYGPIKTIDGMYVDSKK